MGMDKAWGTCPQCGARVELELGDPLLQCDFCKTSLYIRPESGIFSYILPPVKATGSSHDSIVHLPYWRLKGLRFRLLKDKRLKANHVDASLPALSRLTALPSLGISTQLAPLMLNTNKLDFGQNLYPATKALQLMDARIEAGLLEHPISSFILGEKLSLIMAPFELMESTKERLALRSLWTNQDSITVIKDIRAIKYIQKIQEGAEENEKSETKNQAVSFIPLICPECANDLPPLSHVSALFCNSCHRLWALSKDRYLPQKAKILGFAPSSNATYLPFYHFRLNLTGFPVSHRLGLLSYLFPYKKFPENFSEEPIQLVVPAFSVAPTLFMNLGKRLSSSDISFTGTKKTYRMRLRNAWGINFSVHSAIQFLPILLLSLIKGKKKLTSALKKTTFRITGIDLFFMPFEKKGRELIETQTGLAIQAAALRYGLNL